MPSNKLKDLPKRKAVRSTKGSREPDDGHADLAGLVQYRVHGVAREGRVVDGATVVCSPDGKNWARGNGFGEVEGGFGSEDARVEAREDGEVGFRNGVVSLGGGGHQQSAAALGRLGGSEEQTSSTITALKVSGSNLSSRDMPRVESV